MSDVLAQLIPRQRLLEAAEEVFARKGFDGATVREICDRAGMNVAAINYHFGDKERLYTETVRNAHQCGMAQMRLADWPADAPPVERLRSFIQTMARTMHEPVRPTALQLMMREMSNPSPAAEAVVREEIQPMAHRLRGIIAELFPHLSTRTHLMIGFSVVGQCLFYRQNRRVSELLFGADAVNALDADAVADHITRLTLAGLGLAEPYRDLPGGEP